MLAPLARQTAIRAPFSSAASSQDALHFTSRMTQRAGRAGVVGMAPYHASARAQASPNATFSSQRRDQRPLSISRWAAPTAAVTLGMLAHHSFSTTPLLHLDGPGTDKSASSSIFRAASPAAMRTPACQLVFVSVAEDRRDEWGSWIGYFREAGFDCIDLNLAVEGVQPAAQGDVQVFSNELRDQIRLLSLQRRPLLFAQTPHAAHTALAQIQSRDPQMSGLVLVLNGSTGARSERDDGITAQVRNLDVKRMRILVVDQGGERVLHDVEQWMTAEGLL